MFLAIGEEDAGGGDQDGEDFGDRKHGRRIRAGIGVGADDGAKLGQTGQSHVRCGQRRTAEQDNGNDQANQADAGQGEGGLEITVIGLGGTDQLISCEDEARGRQEHENDFDEAVHEEIGARDLGIGELGVGFHR